MKRPDNTARARALYRLRDEHPERFRELLREERVTLGLPPTSGRRERRRAGRRVLNGIACGTRDGFLLHLRRGEEPCRDCVLAKVGFVG